MAECRYRSVVAGVVVLLKFRGNSELWTVLSAGEFCKNFQFFALGIFCRKYRELFDTILSENWFKAGVIICTVVCLVLYYCNGVHSDGALAINFVDLVAHYIVLLLIFTFFFDKREFFEAPTFLNSTLHYIGRHTLDIYMIHYFFLPDLSVLKDWLLPGNMFIIQLAIGLVVSALIVADCMLISGILRSSDFLSNWIFGATPKKQD